MQPQIKIYDFDQRSPEWYKIREGKVTGTSVVNILGKADVQKTKDAIDNLAMKLAIEAVFGMIESDYVDFDMQRGIDLEPSAIGLLADILSEDFIDVSKVGFIEHNQHIGCSPDGITSNNCIAEAKCPKAEIFFKRCITKIIDPNYYKQIQHEIFCADAVGAYYMNYCVHMGREYHYLQFVERDETLISLIKTRCEDVIASKLKYIPLLQEIKSNNGIIQIPNRVPITIHDHNVTVHDSI